MMWNWYASNNLIAYNGLVIQGEIIDIEATKDSIFIRNLPEDAIAYELIIDFDPSTFKTENNSSSEISLSNMNSESGLFVLMASKESSEIALPISIKG